MRPRGFFPQCASPCSYAAIAIAKSLFQKGASAASALAFQLASTNLVFELGLVIWILIGWQFTLAEFVGGAGVSRHPCVPRGTPRWLRRPSRGAGRAFYRSRLTVSSRDRGRSQPQLRGLGVSAICGGHARRCRICSMSGAGPISIPRSEVRFVVVG